MDHQHGDAARSERHRCKVPLRVVGHLLAHEREEPQGIAVYEKRVPIGSGSRHGVARNHAAGPVIHDELLAESSGQSVGGEPCDEIGARPGFGGHDAHGFRWIFLCSGQRRHSDDGGCRSNGCQARNHGGGV